MFPTSQWHSQRYDEQYAVAAACCLRDVTAFVTVAQRGVLFAAPRPCSSGRMGLAAATPRKAEIMNERMSRRQRWQEVGVMWSVGEGSVNGQSAFAIFIGHTNPPRWVSPRTRFSASSLEDMREVERYYGGLDAGVHQYWRRFADLHRDWSIVLFGCVRTSGFSPATGQHTKIPRIP